MNEFEMPFTADWNPQPSPAVLCVEFKTTPCDFDLAAAEREVEYWNSLDNAQVWMDTNGPDDAETRDGETFATDEF